MIAKVTKINQLSRNLIVNIYKKGL